MIKNYIKILFIITGSLLFFSWKAWGQGGLVTTGTPVVYEVTIQKFEISQDGGQTWVTLSDASATFDLAQVSTGKAVGNYLSQNGIQAGTYNAVRITISSTFTIKGYVFYNGLYYYTSPGGTKTTSSWNDNNPPGDYGQQAVQPPDSGDTFTDVDTSHTLTIEPGTTTKISISFDVTGKLGLFNIGGYQLLPTPPTVHVTVE